MNALAGLERTLRLAGRLVKHALRGDSAELRTLTRQGLWARLLRTRKSRLRRWRSETKSKFGGAVSGALKVREPMVSVCMAAYNGARYIEAQLRSIVPQLKETDEVVIIDDASSDTTLEVVERLAQELKKDASSPRFVIVRHSVNRGVVQTFDDALRSASGDILFLADDDDLWAHDRVQRVLDVFQSQPKTRIVATGLSLIDENDQPLQNSDFLRHRRFTANLAANLLHNQFQGSAMAIRSSLLRDILPLPAGKLFLHDVWIGTRNKLAGGEAAFVDEPLLLYRRHTGNYSKRFSRIKQILLRLQLVTAHVVRLRQRL
jgi:glycosyltransferase involved in cell wall biosynthesis